MWPFGKKIPSPEPVSQGDVTALYDPKLKCWNFVSDGLEFSFSGLTFNWMAFDWAKEASLTIQSLGDEINKRVVKCLDHWPCDKSKAKILCVYLDKYEESKTLDLAFIGDESWGDFGVNVIITDGVIVDAYGGD